MFHGFKEMLKAFNVDFIELNENEIAIPMTCLLTEDEASRIFNDEFVGEWPYPFSLSDKNHPPFMVYSDEEFLHIEYTPNGLNWHIMLGERRD